MENEWVTDYLRLALRMDRAFSQVESSYFLDTYYGPPELRIATKHEPVYRFNKLTEEAAALLDRLPDQGFGSSRAEYLGKHVAALHAIAKVKAGEELPFFELVESVFDIEPIWIPEEEFEQVLSMLDQAIPGSGDVRQRFQGWLELVRLENNDSALIIPFMKRMLAEARQRTKAILNLPEGEELLLVPKREVNYGAANWYQGTYRSRLELNLDRPVFLPNLLYQMCHEAYPGHHTESCMKERHLFHEKGYLEQSVFFALGPQVVIAEGIASLAAEMIFSSAEAADWIRHEIPPQVGKNVLDVDLELIMDAFMISGGDDLGSNLSTLFEAGRSEAEVIEYALAYTPFSHEQVNSLLPWLKSPLARLYSFTYSHGKRLMQPLLKSADRTDNIRMLLTEQLTPGMIRRKLADEKN
jgi:hypothetical protein